MGIKVTTWQLKSQGCKPIAQTKSLFDSTSSTYPLGYVLFFTLIRTLTREGLSVNKTVRCVSYHFIYENINFFHYGWKKYNIII